jgi:UDP-N-acetylmuramyl pentapeptide synthase
MLYRWRDVASMLLTPGGRLQFGEGVSHRLWPLFAALAWAWRRSFARRARVVAVTGSFGKTTTTRAATAALRLAPEPDFGRNAWTGVAQALLRIRPAQRHAAIEVGIAARGQMRTYARLLRPDVAVVTAVGSEHVEAIGSLDAIADEKAELVRALPADGLAVLNGDDPRVRAMAGLTAARVVTVGFGAGCDVRATDVALDWPRGSRLTVTAFGATRELALRLVGAPMILPALAAIAVAQDAGFALDETLALLAALPPTPGRMQPVPLADGVVVLRDDYKSTLETMHAALDVLATVPARRVVLFGDVLDPPGGSARAYRELGARVAALAAHFVVIGTGNADYAAGAAQAGMPAQRIHDAGRSPQRAAELLRALLAPGDAVLIKGRRGQTLDRVRMLLEGRPVACAITLCDLRATMCEQCPMLYRSWGGRTMVIRRGMPT